MELKNYFAEKKTFYESILLFLENNEEDNDESLFQQLMDQIKKHNMTKNREEFNHLIGIISSISNNHNRNSGIIKKIEKILIYLKDDIKQTYSNDDLLNIFSGNKLMLLLLVNNKIISNEWICKMQNFHSYFLPEIKSIFSQEKMTKIEKEFLEIDPNILDNYEEKRQKGENDSYICSLIRDDSVEEFISYINRNNISLSSKIKFSLFETNQFLIQKEPTLIEYSAFFGSIQIFQYLLFNNVELKPSLWLYAIHSNSPALIHSLEENNVKAPFNKFETCFEEAVKCHHNDVANYIENNLITHKTQNDKIIFDQKVTVFGFQYSNYLYINEDFSPLNLFFYLCKYGYNKIVNDFIEQRKNDLTKERFIYILIFFFLNKILKNILMQFQKKSYF